MAEAEAETITTSRHQQHHQQQEQEEDEQQPQIPASALIPNKKGPGILMRTLKRGRGDRFPKKGENCLIHFEGYLEDGENDSDNIDTMKRIASTREFLQLRKGFQFELGRGEIIEGIEVACANMIIGQIVEATIPSLYGYGHQGFPPHIPPRATLIFHIELVDIINTTTDNTDDVNDVDHHNHCHHREDN